MLKSLTAVLILAGALILQGAAFAQQQAQQPQQPAASSASPDQEIELMRQDVRSQKKQIVAANLELTDAEATKFWPVYDAYAADATKIGDARLAIIKEYAQSYNTLTDAQAKDLIKRWAATDQQAQNLVMQYIPKFEAVLPGKKAAIFFQINHRLDLLIDLQLASSIPLVKQ
jgi:hypothetical protein